MCRCEHSALDRILAAQSLIESIPLVTSDSVFGTIGGVRTLWA